MGSIKSDNQIKKEIKEAQGNTKAVYCPIDGYKGLRIRIRGSAVEFQHRYTHPITKKSVEMTLGHYEDGYTLKQATEAHRTNLALLSQQIDPKTYRNDELSKKAFSLGNTFRDVATHWLDEQTNNPDHVLAEQTLKNWGFYLSLY